MREDIEVKLQALNELKDKLSEVENLKYSTKITALRGRYIRKLESLKRYLSRLGDLSPEEMKLAEQTNIMISQEMFKHKRQLEERYNNELIHGEAKVPDVVTTLPKGMALQARKIATSTSQIINATTSKAKMTAVVDFLKDTGILVATPVIFAGKFIVEHWYLLMLLFSWRLHRRSKRPKKPKEQEERVPEEAPEYVTENAHELSHEQVLAGEPEAVPREVPEQAPDGVPDTVMANDSAINYETDPRFSRQDVPAEAEAAQPAPQDANPRPAIDYESDPRFSRQDAKEPVVANEPAGGSAINYETDPRFHAQEGVPVENAAADDVLTTYNVSPEQAEQVSEQYTTTLNRLNERSNGQFFIREVDSLNVEHSDIVICRTPMEYLTECCKYCDFDPVEMHFVEGDTITPAGYEFMIERNIGTFWQDTRLDQFVFEDPTQQYLPEFNNALGYDVSGMYDRFTTVRCFETVADFNAALLNDDPMYNELREEFIREMNVSESAEAMQCLAALGLLTVGGATAEMALPVVAGLAANAPEVLAELQNLLHIVGTNPSTAYSIADLAVMTP